MSKVRINPAWIRDNPMGDECSTCEFWKKDGTCEQLAEALETDIGVISVKPSKGFYWSIYKGEV